MSSFRAAESPRPLLPPLSHKDAEAAKAQWRKVAEHLRAKLPKLAAFADQEADVLAYTSVRLTSPFSRSSGLVECVVGIFSNEMNGPFSGHVTWRLESIALIERYFHRQLARGDLTGQSRRRGDDNRALTPPQGT